MVKYIRKVPSQSGHMTYQNRIICVHCQRIYHRSCLNDSALEGTWSCSRCGMCDLCGESKSRFGNSIHQCYVCRRSYHSRCQHFQWQMLNGNKEWVCRPCGASFVVDSSDVSVESSPKKQRTDSLKGHQCSGDSSSSPGWPKERGRRHYEAFWSVQEVPRRLREPRPAEVYVKSMGGSRGLVGMRRPESSGPLTSESSLSPTKSVDAEPVPSEDASQELQSEPLQEQAASSGGIAQSFE